MFDGFNTINSILPSSYPIKVGIVREHPAIAKMLFVCCRNTNFEYTCYQY